MKNSEKMPVMDSATSSPSEDELVSSTLKRVSQSNGYVQLPSSSQILERLYHDHGVRIRMVRRNRPRKIPTVRELIDHLSKKHEKLLEMEGKSAKLDNPPVRDRHRVSLESIPDHDGDRDMSFGREIKNNRVNNQIGPRLAVLPSTRKTIEGLIENRGKLDPLLGPNRSSSVTDKLSHKDIIISTCKKRFQPIRIQRSATFHILGDKESDYSRGQLIRLWTSSNLLYSQWTQKMSFPEYVSKFRRKMVEIRSRFKETSRLGLYADYWVPPPSEASPYPLTSSSSSSSTPTVPYSTADILYGSEVNSKPPIEELRQNSLDLERSKELSRLKSKELEQHPNNRRPNSKSASRKSLSIEAVNIDKEKEDPLKGLSNTLPPTKPSNHFRPNGIRSNILKGEQMFSARSNGALPGRDPDDLVAMGTLWSPNNQNSTQTVATPPQQQMSRNSLPNNISSNTFPSKSNPSSSSVNPSMSASTTVTPQRKYTSNNVRPSVIQNNTISGIKNNLKDKEKEKDVEPKYSDPLIGAPAAYQQRLIELGALEGDTVRWERTKRLKKKKQDRDS